MTLLRVSRKEWANCTVNDLDKLVLWYMGQVHFKILPVQLQVGYSIISTGLPEYVALLFYVHGEHLRSCRDGQLT